jgi:hypothetical protein
VDRHVVVVVTVATLSLRSGTCATTTSPVRTGGVKRVPAPGAAKQKVRAIGAGFAIEGGVNAYFSSMSFTVLPAGIMGSTCSV